MIVGYPDPDKLPAETKAALERFPPLNVIRALGLAPTYAPGLVDMAIAGLSKLSLTERQRELLIIEVASRTQCVMVFEDHRPLCYAVGVTDGEMDALWRQESFPITVDETETILLRIARELLTHARCPASLMDTAQQTFGSRVVAETVILVGYYRMIASFANVFEVEPDPYGEVEAQVLPLCGRDDD